MTQPGENRPSAPGAVKLRARYQRGRWRRSGMGRVGAGVLGAVIATSTLMGITAGEAHAATLPKNLVKFEHCPFDNPAVVLCAYGSMTGSFTISSTTLTTPSPATLTLGLATNSSGLYAVAPTDGTPALSSPPIPVSIFGLPSLPSPLGITATPTLVGTPSVSLVNLLGGTGTAVGVSVYVQLNNVLLGNNCTIGTPTDPININLTTGTTAPPPPNQPVTGSRGTVTNNAKTDITKVTGVKLVDNTFSVPGASGCGLFGALDPAFDLIEGLPSAAGHNAASFSGKTWLVPASIMRSYLG